MDTIVFAGVMLMGGWTMYLIGRYHGYTEGKRDTLNRVGKRYPYRSFIYDSYDK